MRILKSAKDRIEFMLDFVSIELMNANGFTEADLQVLREEFCRYLGYQRLKDGTVTHDYPDSSIEDYGGFFPVVSEPPLPQDFQREDFLSLQQKMRTFLHQRTTLEEEMMVGIWHALAAEGVVTHDLAKKKTRGKAPSLEVPKGREGVPLSVKISDGMVILGSAPDVAFFIFFMVAPRWSVLRCPNWESRVCQRKFFLKEGKSIYCSLRCGNAYRVKKSLGLKNLQIKIQSLQHKGAEEISKRLGVNVDLVHQLLKKNRRGERGSSPRVKSKGGR